MSFAPRFTSLRRAASSTIRRNSPSHLSVSPFCERSTDLPVRSRPSRKLPSHSPAASCADSQLNCHRAASPSRKLRAVVYRLGPFCKQHGCWLSRKDCATEPNRRGSIGHLLRAGHIKSGLDICFPHSAPEADFKVYSGHFRQFQGLGICSPLVDLLCGAICTGEAPSKWATALERHAESQPGRTVSLRALFTFNHTRVQPPRYISRLP